MPKDRIVPYSNQSGPVRTRRIAPGFAGESSSADRRAAKRAVSGSQGDGRNGAVGRTRANAHSAADERTLLVDGIEVRLSRKRVKNLNLRISRDGSHVDVSASSWVSEDEVCDFVRRKAAWIESHLAQAADTPMARASQAKPEEVAQWREVVSACVPALIAAWEPIMGVRAGKLAYRNMTSRWGSCQPATGPHLHQRAVGTLSAGMLGICGRPRAVSLAGARPRSKVPPAHGRVYARLESSSREAALGDGGAPRGLCAPVGLSRWLGACVGLPALLRSRVGLSSKPRDPVAMPKNPLGLCWDET